MRDSGKSDEQSPRSQDDASGGDRLGQIIAAYLESDQAATELDRDQLLSRYPDLAEELKQFFADHDRMKQLSGPEKTMAGPQADAAATDTSPRPPDSEGPPSAGGERRRFGDYELLQEIDRGGMGVVYRARQISLNRIVALKMILAGRLASDEDVQRFHSEAEAAANLDHPGIVPIHEVGQHEGCHYFSMGLVEGPSLAVRLADGPLSVREAAEITQKVADAVAYAHARGVIHRDLKPANILLSPGLTKDEGSQPSPVHPGGSSVPRITDFGLAKRVEADHGLTTPGQILGTPSYMPPEQACGKVEEVGEASDVYSIGAILYALLTGRPPFEADHHLDVLIQVIEQDVKSPRELNRKVPRNLNTICLKCLSKEPPRRYESAQALADDLLRFLNGEPIEARPLGPVGQLYRWAKSHPALAVTWTALGVFYLIHLICLWILKLPGEGGTFHEALTGLVAVWALGAWAFQRLALRAGLAVAVLYGWTTMDVILFTAVLIIANGPSSPLIIGYLLLIAGAGLRFRNRLVWFVTGFSIAGYVWLVLDARWYRPDVQAPLHARLYFVVSLVVMGLIMHLVLRRVSAITRTGGTRAHGG